MFKKFWIAFCCFLGILSLSISVDAASLAKKFYNDHDNVFVFDHTEKFGIKAPGHLEEITYDGYIALCELDLDGNGSEELLTIRIGGDSVSESNSLYADLYIRYDGEWDKQASYKLAEDLLKYEESDCSVFLLKKSKGYFLGCEHKEVASVTDTAFLWSFRLTSFNHEPFDEMLNLSLDDKPSSKKLNALKKKFKKYGFDSTDIISTPICDTLKALPDTFSMVSSVKREKTKRLEALLKHMNHGDGTAYEYGNTIFKSYVNKKWANKNESDFSSKYFQMDEDDDYDYEDDDDDTDRTKPHSTYKDDDDDDDDYDRDYYEDYDDDYLDGYFPSGKDNDIIIETEGSKNSTGKRPSKGNSSSSSSENIKDPYLSDYYPYAEEFIFWDSSVRLLSEEELWNLSYDDLRIARNEIYARHGRIFDNYDLSTYFNSLSWYRERVPAKSFTYEYAKKHFNDIEIKNIDLIKAYEESMGY